MQEDLENFEFEKAERQILAKQAEASYRRGVHHAIYFCWETVCRAKDLQTALQELDRAETKAEEIRFDTGRDHDMLLNEIATAVYSKDKVF